MERQGKYCSTVKDDHQNRYKFAARLFDKAPRTCRIVDLCCGTGYGSRIILDATDSNVIAVDVDEFTTGNIAKDYVEYVVSGRLRIVTADVTDDAGQGAVVNEVTAGGADMVCFFEAIEHLAKPEKALALANTMLRRRGILMVSAPNEIGFPFNADNFKADKYPHLRHYRPEEFKAAVEDAGFYISRKLGQNGKNGPKAELREDWFLTGRTMVMEAVKV